MIAEQELFRWEKKGIRIEIADTPAVVRESQALRHRVFCVERKIFASEIGQTSERDEFDERSRHVVIRRDADDEVIATARVVVGSSLPGADCLPMQRYCCPSLFRGFRMDKMGEISRFAISKECRRGASISGPMLRLGLLQGILRVSEEQDLTHWCGLMEPSLLRLLAATGVHFAPLGPIVEAHGLRQPSIAAIAMTLAHGRRQRPDYYTFIKQEQFPRGNRAGSLVA